MTDATHHHETPAHHDAHVHHASPPWGLQKAFYAAGLGAIVVGVIYLGQPILMPAALSILLAFALAPVMTRLRLIGVGRVTSVLVTVLFAFVVLGAFGTYVVTEFAALARALPSYESNLAHKINSLRGAAAGNSVFATASAMLERLDNDITAPPKSDIPHPTARPSPQPVVVEIPSQEDSPLHIVESIVGPLLQPLATGTIVVIFVIFILLQKEDLRDRFIRLAGAHDLRRTTMALDDGAARLSRYLLLQTTINSCFGIVIGSGLWIIGIPNPGLWGLIATMFRFVPYVGVPVAAIIPSALAFAVDPNWAKLFETVALYSVVESILGQAIEPFVYGKSIGLSATAIVVAATFWTWAWGPVGLLLSTPLTMCLVVIGRHVDQLRFLDVLLGDRPPLAQEESLYLRMLGGDPDEAAHQAEAFLEKNSISTYYDEVVVKALVMAQDDARHGVLDRDRRHMIHLAVEGLMQNLSDRGDDAKAGSVHGETPVAESWHEDAVVCVAGPGALDDIAALLLSDLLRRHQIGARVVSHAEALPVNIDRLEGFDAKLVCVCYLEPANFTNARFLVRRLKRHFPNANLFLNFWGLGTDETRYQDAIEATGCELIASSVREALERILYMAKHDGAVSAPTRTGALVA